MAKAPPLLPCIMNRVPGFSIFRNFFFPLPPSLSLPFNTAKDSTNSFRNEKLTSLSVYVKREGVWFFFFYIFKFLTKYFYSDDQGILRIASGMQVTNCLLP